MSNKIPNISWFKLSHSRPLQLFLCTNTSYVFLRLHVTTVFFGSFEMTRQTQVSKYEGVLKTCFHFQPEAYFHLHGVDPILTSLHMKVHNFQAIKQSRQAPCA